MHGTEKKAGKKHKEGKGGRMQGIPYGPWGERKGREGKRGRLLKKNRELSMDRAARQEERLQRRDKCWSWRHKLDLERKGREKG